MDLKDFVAASLKQIVEGVKEAQASAEGNHVNAVNGAGIPLGKGAYSGGTFGNFTLVEFDVAVSAESAGKGGANLKVFGLGFEGGGEHKAGSANRISFAVPVRLPDGDSKRSDDVTKRQQASMDRANRSRLVV
jgi:hypothetical protein